LTERRRTALIDIRISKNNDNLTFIHIEARTTAINPDISGIIFKKRELLLGESSLSFACLMYREIDCRIRKYNNLLVMVNITRFLK
jgi:hypothetical protein